MDCVKLWHQASHDLQSKLFESIILGTPCSLTNIQPASQDNLTGSNILQVARWTTQSQNQTQNHAGHSRSLTFFLGSYYGLTLHVKRGREGEKEMGRDKEMEREKELNLSRVPIIYIYTLRFSWAPFEITLSICSANLCRPLAVNSLQLLLSAIVFVVTINYNVYCILGRNGHDNELAQFFCQLSLSLCFGTFAPFNAIEWRVANNNKGTLRLQVC